MEKVRVIGERVMVEQFQPEKQGSIHLPGNATEGIKPMIRNVIVEVGDGELCKKFAVGDEVLVDVQRAIEVPLNGRKYLIIDAHGVVAVKTTSNVLN